jgi:hypothetical protein
MADQRTHERELEGAPEFASFDIAAWVRASRAAQGLPENIEDEILLTRVLIMAGLLDRPAKPLGSSPDGTRESRPAAEAPLPSRARL